MAAQDGSGKLSCSHPIDPLVDHNLSVLAIADVPAENPLASLPAHFVARAPNRGYLGRCYLGAPGSLLTCLSWLSRRQAVFAGQILILGSESSDGTKRHDPLSDPPRHVLSPGPKNRRDTGSPRARR
jgi:hypothetical protein